MKTYLTYVCDICNKSSFNKAEIELCEGIHMGLNTLNEKHEYDELNERVKRCSATASITHNADTESRLDNAIAKLLEFERIHCIKNIPS